jgi:hypothetical protein
MVKGKLPMLYLIPIGLSQAQGSLVTCKSEKMMTTYLNPYRQHQSMNVKIMHHSTAINLAMLLIREVSQPLKVWASISLASSLDDCPWCLLVWDDLRI